MRAHGFGGAHAVALPADASSRRYSRLREGPRPALLMDAPPPEDVRPFVRIAKRIRAAGLSAPEVIAEDADAGFLIIEDFGEETHAALLDTGASAVPLYHEAADALARLHVDVGAGGLPAWDAEAMAKATAATLLDWWWPAAIGGVAPEAARTGLSTALVQMLTPFAAKDFVHRDYFPANLMRISARAGVARTGILDFQDAGAGHPAYDLVSLVEDARRDVSAEVRASTVDRYLARRPELDRDEFLAAMAAFGAQRHLRVAALWVRLAKRDGKPRYLAHGPRCWALLDHSIAHAACRPLRAYLDAWVPPGLRGNPPSAEAVAA